MAILITGGTGFIGSHTVVEFIQAGEQFPCLFPCAHINLNMTSNEM